MQSILYSHSYLNIDKSIKFDYISNFELPYHYITSMRNQFFKVKIMQITNARLVPFTKLFKTRRQMIKNLEHIKSFKGKELVGESLCLNVLIYCLDDLILQAFTIKIIYRNRNIKCKYSLRHKTVRFLQKTKQTKILRPTKLLCRWLCFTIVINRFL